MAKDFQKTCPDCDGPDWGSLYIKGDGNCNVCHGKGKVWSIGEGLEIFRLDIEKVEPCKTCYGTGQCQTCGGEGYQYYNSDEKYTPTNSPLSTPTKSDNSSSSSFSGLFEGLLVLLLLAPFVNWYNSCHKKQPKVSDSTETIQAISPLVETQTSFNQNLLDGKWIKKAGLGGNRNEDGLIISFKNNEGTAIYVPKSAQINEGQVIWKNFNAENKWIEVYLNLSGGYLNSGIRFIDSKTIKINFDTFKRK